MSSKFEQTTKLHLGASSAYVALLRREGHSLQTVPFVRKPRSTKPNRCRINAEYKEQQETRDWVTNASTEQLVNLRWNTLRKSYAAPTSSNPRFLTPPPPSAADITDLRIDLSDPDDANNTSHPVEHPAASNVTFVALERLLLVGFGRKLYLLPFHWDTSCPNVVNLRLEGQHSIEDVHAILRGCPVLKELTVSTIANRGRITSEPVEHGSLEKLTLVSNIPAVPILRNLQIPKLESLNLWTTPDLACNTIGTLRPLLRSVESICAVEASAWVLGLNFDIPQRAIQQLGDKGITYTRLR
ncbi:hypothetical protein BDN72DRAFT_905197 [Pluteus cervinus]|uniref:Uncharacterized protein n=1 Tax=Pluteus cervinus TaxID=181527 RepID=A0ACD3A3B5_9AGAR|nr:hypothetical protein BDN72DRAFT_905197 [Pluteus cervinus]